MYTPVQIALSFVIVILFVVWVAAEICLAISKVKRFVSGHRRSNAERTVDAMFEHEYAGTRNAKQSIKRGQHG
jgi:hypothetical protein